MCTCVHVCVYVRLLYVCVYVCVYICSIDFPIIPFLLDVPVIFFSSCTSF